MDAYLAIVSKREVRRYRNQPIPDDVLTQILEAGRASGSSRNRQPWRFIVVADPGRLKTLGALVSRPANIEGCAAAVAVATVDSRASFDAGRAAQNMMLAAWALGIGTCPNTPTDQTSVAGMLGLPEGAAVPTIISLGYPASGERRPPRKADPAALLSRINRLPLAELVRREVYT